MKTTKGNLLDLFDQGLFDVIIQGCNCHWAMAAGIADQISKRYPKAKQVDKQNSEYGDLKKLSNFTIANVAERPMERKTIINLYTQFFPGRAYDENAILLGFTKLAMLIPKHYRIGIPAIGCGIAGGDWEILQPKIADIMKDYDITYVEYENN